MIIWGMVGGCHDATISIFKDSTCVKTYYSTENRHSQSLIDKAFKYGKPDLVVWYLNHLSVIISASICGG